LHHAAFGSPEDADLVGALLWDQTAVVAPTTHDRGGRSRRHRRRERCRAGTVVVGGAVVVIRPDGRICIAGVGVQIARDLGADR